MIYYGRMNRFYAKEWRPGLYHVIDRLNNLPLYDDEGESALVFDEDHALNYLETIQEELNETKPINHHLIDSSLSGGR